MSHTLWIFVAVASALKGVGEDTCNTDCEQRKLLAINAYDKGSRDLFETADPGANSDNLGNLGKSAELRSALVEDAAPTAAEELQRQIRNIGKELESLRPGEDKDAEERLLAMKAMLEKPTQVDLDTVLAAMQTATNKAHSLDAEYNRMIVGPTGRTVALSSQLAADVRNSTNSLIEEALGLNREREHNQIGTRVYGTRGMYDWPWPPKTKFEADSMIAAANDLDRRIAEAEAKIKSQKDEIREKSVEATEKRMKASDDDREGGGYPVPQNKKGWHASVQSWK